MQRRTVAGAVCLGVLFLMAASPALAQEGHPLTGSWHGEWHPTASQKLPVRMYMKWNSKSIEGAINPGPNSIPLKVATLDANNWTVHFEGEGKDASGNPVHVSIDGKIENLGSYNRTITGTWSQGSAKGQFQLTRD